jgi:hypothetical protein
LSAVRPIIARATTTTLWRESGWSGLALAVAFVLAAVTVGHGADEETPMQPPDSAAVRAATEERVRSLGQELGRIAQQHGPDSVALQAAFLLQAMRAGARGVTEVRVVGPSPREGDAYLEIDVTTGLVLDRDSGDSSSWNARMWDEIVAPVLDAMDGFDIRPGGLEIVVNYGTQRFSEQSEHKADLAEPVTHNTIRFVLPAAALGDLAAGRQSLAEVRPAALRLDRPSPPVASPDAD